VTRLIDGEKEPGLAVDEEAEVRVHGWWPTRSDASGRSVWACQGRSAQEAGCPILMLADEISSQDIHGIQEDVTQSAATR